MRYLVNDIYPCIQGEGVNSGLPMVMLRLHGCGVGCPWCDTKETWDILPEFKAVSIPEALGANQSYAEVTESEIIQYLLRDPVLKLHRWVLISGGEPGQQELRELCVALKEAGAKIAVETSGTATGILGSPIDWLTVSPKVNMPGGKTIKGDVVKQANELKFVIGKPYDVDQAVKFLRTYAPFSNDPEICVQPVSMSQKATEICIEAARRHQWRVSIQTHKLVSQR